MRMPVNLMIAIGRAALNAAGAGLVGDIAEIAKAAWEDWKKSPEERIEELEAVLRADDEQIDCGVADVVSAVAGDEPEPVRMKLATFLKQLPSQARRSQRRPSDPVGRSIGPGLVLDRPEDLIPFIPDPGRLPRFQPGDHPPGIGDWVLSELLGIGGFGEVWKARNTHFTSLAPVALKFCTDLQAREALLLHEAKVLDRVMRQGQHPGIVRLEATFLSADPPCLQYEFVDGGDLGGLILAWHRQAEKPTPVQIATALLQIAEIVAFAHRLEPPIVHRDLKPANILVQRSDSDIRLRITDFGIGGIATSRAIQATRQATSPSQFLATAVRGSGTWLYASPEQLRGDPPDPRDDVHALGVIWYQMLTGDLTRSRPGGSSWRRRFNERGMPAAMLDLLESCFEEQDERPEDASLLAEKLGQVLQVASIGVGPEVIASPPPQPREQSTESVRKRDRKSSGNAQRPSSVRAETQLAPTQEPLGEIVNSIGMRLRLIPVGEFSMGSPKSDVDAFRDEKPQHRVRITRPFYLGLYPVMFCEYAKLIKKPSAYISGAENCPVGGVTWCEALEFCNALSLAEHLPPFYALDGITAEVTDWHGIGYRLPTEAEWEYACRAGSETRYSFGDNPRILGKYAWYSNNSGDKTQPVGQKKSNAFGLFDVHGNVWEWCWDAYNRDYYKESTDADPCGPKGSGARVFRGGSFRGYPRAIRSSNRGHNESTYHDEALGFRVARSNSTG